MIKSTKISFKGAFLVDVKNENLIIRYEDGKNIKIPLVLKNDKKNS